MKPLFKLFRRFLTTDDIKKMIRENSCGFDKNLKKVTFTEVGCGKCVAEMKVCEEHSNASDALHGGMAITLVHAVTTFALLTHCDSLCIPSLSVDMFVSYLRPARRGEEIVIYGDTIRVGTSLAFTKCVMTHKQKGMILLSGYHTKYLLRS